MMPINKDALIQKVKEEEQKRNLDKEDASLLRLFIECYAEPVDAIPTEWIRHWAARTIKFTDIHKKSVFRDTISLLLMDWEATQRGAKSGNDEWIEMIETMMKAEHKREEEKDERSKD